MKIIEDREIERGKRLPGESKNDKKLSEELRKRE